MEVTAQQVDSSIAARMECGTLNIMWKVRHSRCSVLSSLNEVRYSEH